MVDWRPRRRHLGAGFRRIAQAAWPTGGFRVKIFCDRRTSGFADQREMAGKNFGRDCKRWETQKLWTAIHAFQINGDFMSIYQIKNWNTHYENAKSRETERCRFCCIPNKQDGLGYGLLLAEPNGEALYGAFVAVVLVASKQKNRDGWLTDNGLPTGHPLTARLLSVKCRISEATIARMLEVAATTDIDWIVALTTAEVSAKYPPVTLEQKGREQNGTEPKERKAENEPALRAAPSLEEACVWCETNLAGYDHAQIKSVWASFEATKTPQGFWKMGLGTVTDWHMALSGRLADRYPQKKTAPQGDYDLQTPPPPPATEPLTMDAMNPE